MEQVLDKCMTPTTDMIIQLIEIENAHINTNHPDFVGSADTLLNLFAGERDNADHDEGFEDKQKPISLINKNQNGPSKDKQQNPKED
jgi:hypothetical protein